MMVDYQLIKYFHISFALISATLFTLRVIFQWQGKNWRRFRFLRYLPHINDALLLIAAIVLMTTSGQYPFVQPWLTAKIFALITYILLGYYTLRKVTDQSQSYVRLMLQQKITAILAFCTLFYIFSVALTHSASLGLMTSNL